MKNLIGIILLVVFNGTLLSPESSMLQKPKDFVFGQDIKNVKEQLQSKCTKITQETISPIQLPTAKTTQQQLNCSGYFYAGKKRDVELVFADGSLDLVWILTTAEEEQYFLNLFAKLYGNPTHQLKEATFFLNDGIGVRNNPHEVLFISDRLKAPYKQWLDSQLNLVKN